MKQETGSNTQKTTDKVSIQLALDGHSFSTPVLGEAYPGDGPVEVEVLTPRTLLVPAEVFDAERAADLLAAAGMSAATDECVVFSAPQAEIVAVMALNGDLRQLVEQRLGTRARFTTPLLTTPPKTDKRVWVCNMAGLLYIKVYDGALRFAEVIPAPGEADTRYLFERLGTKFPFKNYGLQLAGDDTKILRKLAGNRFKKVICE